MLVLSRWELAIIFLLGCLAVGHPAHAAKDNIPPVICKADGATGLIVSGPTDDAMLACFRSFGAQSLDRITITSLGGPVDRGVDIAELLAPLRPHIIVKQQCISSCANYILPMARRITLRRLSLVGLHGSLGQSNIDRAPPESKAKGIEVVRKQEEFFARRNIHLGWVQRGASNRPPSFGPYVEGDEALIARLPKLGTVTRTGGIIIAEEGYLRSCFPAIEIDPFINTVTDYFYKRKSSARKLVAQGAYPSGPMRCRPRDANGAVILRAE